MMAITIPLLILEVLVGVGVVSFPSYERSHLCLYGTWYMLAFHLSFLLELLFQKMREMTEK